MATAWSDTPIKAKSEDAFERADYAVRAAQLIAASHSWEDSIVFGLTGPWGSGKSSMLAMIAEELANSEANWRVARFTPWATNDIGGLLGDFYASLSAALPNKKGRQVRNALGTLAQLSAPTASAIPWAGGAVSAAAMKAGETIKQQEPWDKAFHKAVSELKKLDTPVLLIADDIDRLQTDELLALLKVVRLLGRFPGVHYLLAYDETTLFHALSGANLVDGADGAANRFMEKIVQYPLVVPPLLKIQLLSRLESGLDAAFAEAGRAQVTSARLGKLINVFRSQLSTPRAIDRYLAQVRHHLPLVPQDEINDEDVVVLTLLRTAFPTLYAQLPRWRDELISGHTGELKKAGTSVSGMMEYEPFSFDFLLKEIPSRSRGDARTLLMDLFPKLIQKGPTIHLPVTLRIGDARYFDRYFAMGIPSHDIPDSEVAEAVSAACRGQGNKLEGLLTQTDADRLLLVIEKAINTASTSIRLGSTGDAERLSLLRVVVQIVDRVPDTSSFWTSPRQHVSAWMADNLAQLSDDVTATTVTDMLRTAPRLINQLQIVLNLVGRDYLPAWWLGVVDDLKQPVTTELIAHIQEGDNASTDEGYGSMIYYLVVHNQEQQIKQALAGGLDAGKFTVADVAARFVRCSRISAPKSRWRLADFNQEAFDRIAPDTDDLWYQTPAIDVDEEDLSWANRRAYAAGRARKPPAPSNPTTP